MISPGASTLQRPEYTAPNEEWDAYFEAKYGANFRRRFSWDDYWESEDDILKAIRAALTEEETE